MVQCLEKKIFINYSYCKQTVMSYTTIAIIYCTQCNATCSLTSSTEVLTPERTWSSMLIVVSFIPHVSLGLTIFGKLDAVSCVVASRLRKNSLA